MTPTPIRLRAADVSETRHFCPEREGGCNASLTETDFECGYCTNCGFDLIADDADDDDLWDDELSQAERDLRREQLSK